jgi:hypothetical protein
VNLDTLTKSGSAVAHVNAGVALFNDGLIAVNDGTLVLATAPDQMSGTTTINAPGILAGSTALIFNGGELTGDGVIMANVVNNGALVRPGGTGDTATLSIVGNYTQASGGALAVEIAGTAAGEFDVLSVTGTVTLAGALHAAMINGAAAPSGSNFPIVAASNRVGTFATTNLAAGLSTVYTADGLVLAGPPDPLIVTTTADTVDANDGLTSFREAILFANTNPGIDTITFDIPGNGVHTISPTTALPLISGVTKIQGYSQPGTSKNTLFSGTNAQLLIELDGSGAGATDGLVLAGGQSVVEGLIINGFAGNGIVVQNANFNTIIGCFIGTDATGTAAIPNGGSGVFINNTQGNFVGNASPAGINLISGNTLNGVHISGANAEGNFVGANLIGTKDSGNAALGNGQAGVRIENAPDNAVGGPGIETFERNVISGNLGHGVIIIGTGATNNLVVGNYIGTNGTAKSPLGNLLSGVQIEGGASGNVVGGALHRDGNIISANGDGVSVEGSGTSNNAISANNIGTDETGTIALGNLSHGVLLGGGATQNTIGGRGAGQRNVISGNLSVGVEISGTGTSNNSVLGNYIGTDAPGLHSLTNSIGLALTGGANLNFIGGNVAGAGNVISGNDIGIIISGGVTVTSNVVQGNRIGTDAAGTGPLPNDGPGVAIVEAAGNSIGGTTAGAGNVIAFNHGPGIAIAPLAGATGNAILQNSIHSNTGSGIDLGDDGFTPNDPAPDADTGANGLQNFPVITASFLAPGEATVNGTVTSTPNATLRVEIFAGVDPDGDGVVQGTTFLGFATVNTDSSGNGTFTLDVSGIGTFDYLTSTSTDTTTGNTSEFGLAVRGFGLPIIVDSKHPFTFTDASGDKVRVKLTGHGTIEVILQGGGQANADLGLLDVFNTDLGTQISVSIISKPSGGTTLWRVQTNGTQQHLGGLTLGPGVTFGDGVADDIPDLHISGKSNKLVFDDIAPNTFVKLGDGLPYNLPGDKDPDSRNNRPALTIGDITGAGVRIEALGDGTPEGVGGGGFGNVTIGSWQFQGFLRTTQSIGNFLVKNGNFLAVLEIDKFHNGAGTEADVGTMTIPNGSWGSSGTEIEGDVQGFSAQAFLAGATITAATIGAVKFTTGAFAGTLILTDPDSPAVPTFTVNSNFTGSVISAQSIRKLNIKGDFTGSLQAPSIGSITAFAFLGTAGMTQIVATDGGLGSIKSTAGVIRDYELNTPLSFGGITVKLSKLTSDTIGIDNVHITAASIGNISVTLAADKNSTGVDLTGIRNSDFITTATGITKTTTGKMGNISVTLTGAAGGNGLGIDDGTFDSRVLANEFGVNQASTVNPLGNVLVKLTGFGGDSTGMNNARFEGDTIGVVKNTVLMGKGTPTGRGVTGGIDFIATKNILSMTFDGDVSLPQVTQMSAYAGGKIGPVTIKSKIAANGSLVDSSILAGQTLSLTGTDKEVKAKLAAAGLGALNVSGAVSNSTIAAGGSLGAVIVGGALSDSVILAGAMLGTDNELGGGDDVFQRAAAIASVIVKGGLTRTSIAAGVNAGNGIYGDGDDTLAAAAGVLTTSSSIGAITLASTGATGAAAAHQYAIQAAAIKSINASATKYTDFSAGLYLDNAPGGEDADDILVRLIQ